METLSARRDEFYFFDLISWLQGFEKFVEGDGRKEDQNFKSLAITSSNNDTNIEGDLPKKNERRRSRVFHLTVFN
jgi:hypothetical protein